MNRRDRPAPFGAASRAWPVPVILGVSIIAQQAFFASRYDVSGHAAEHLGSASAPFFAPALVAILLWATPLARRQADVLAGAVAWLAATVVVLVGNFRVIDDLVAAGFGKVGTADVPDIADHDLANLAPWIAVVAASLLTAAVWRRRHVSNRVAGAAAALNILFPPWIIPGAGIVVLVVARCVSRVKQPNAL